MLDIKTNVSCWNLTKTKRLLHVLFLHLDLYRHQNFIVLFLWMTRDQILSCFPLEESICCFMGVTTHTPTTEIPQILTWLHYMVPFRDWTKIQDRSGECDLLHFPISLCSQNPRSSHYLTGIFSSEWTHYTLNLRTPRYQTWCCHNKHSKNPSHIHHLPCVGP
jgi:hypothetical protein